MRGQNHHVSFRFNVASVDIKKFENKYDYPDFITNYSSIGEAAWQ